MLTLIYVSAIGFGLYYVAQLLGPSMKQPLPEAPQGQTEAAGPKPVEFQPESRVYDIDYLNTLLGEKNKEIWRLKQELDVQRGHRVAFEKVKEVMETEILALREQNRTLKSEPKQLL